MPVTKSAIKKVRVDRRRYIFNLRLKKRYKAALKKHLKERTLETLKRVYALLDRAAKKHIIHKNKAARLKSKAAKAVKESETKPKKDTRKKAKVKTDKKKKATTKTVKKTGKSKSKKA